MCAGNHPDLLVRQVSLHDPVVEPLLDELAHEYATRYERDPVQMHKSLRVDFPAEEFAAPTGTMLVVLEGGSAVAGGAFRRYDAETAEIKRVWTHSEHRRRGLARRTLDELESEAARRGYQRMYLTTGTRQPEARGLYLRAGYTPLFDTAADPQELTGPLPFTKRL